MGSGSRCLEVRPGMWFEKLRSDRQCDTWVSATSSPHQSHEHAAGTALVSTESYEVTVAYVLENSAVGQYSVHVRERKDAESTGTEPLVANCGYNPSFSAVGGYQVHTNHIGMQLRFVTWESIQ